MFTNLIESSSHGSEFRRRGSFFLFTTASYALLFIIAGVVSIYAYDARMEDLNLEIVTMMPMVDLPIDKPPALLPASKPISSTNSASKGSYFRREIALANVNEPTIVPDKISTRANVHLPMPKAGIVRPGPDSDPSPGDSLAANGGSTPRAVNVVVHIDTPPPPPVQTPVPKVVRKQIINGEAVYLPKPPYPAMAKQLKIHGVVSVQVLVDENGTVVSAKAVSGNAFLVNEAQKAAFQARFAPRLGDQAVKVSGVITYNFVLQQ
ncbi:MAG: energy transducer TonB [Pyrinomonadaceae bacterium]|nr:energy transducer TonB [Pyrinomonadaceae bacterium]